jgi:hypothetical protein
MWNYIKIKTSLKKKNNQQTEKTTYRTGKIFANYSLDIGLISTIYKKLNSKKKM